MPSRKQKSPKPQGAKDLVKKSLEQTDPHSFEAEQCVLGAIIIDNGAMHEVLKEKVADMFYMKQHSTIFNAIRHVIENGDVADLITVGDRLKATKELDEIGGPAYLSTLIDAVPSSANITSHIKLVKKKWVSREVLHVSTEAALACYDESHGDPESVMSALQQKLITIQFRTQSSVVSNANEIVDLGEAALDEFYESKGKITGLPAGLREVDELVWGYQPSDFVIVGARPSMGKTALGLLMLLSQTKSGFPAAYFTPEMSKTQLSIRMICMENRINALDVRRGIINPEPLKEQANRMLRTLPLYIDDTPGLLLHQARAKTIALVSQYGIKVAFFDYMQLMKTGTSADEKERTKLTEIGYGLKALAKELDITVVGLSQLSRAVEQTKSRRPEMQHLRESGALDDAADVIHLIYRPERYGLLESRKGQAEIITCKSRNGAVGSCWAEFIEDYTLFRNLHKDIPPSPAMQADEEYFARAHVGNGDAPPHPAEMPKDDDHWEYSQKSMF